MWALNGTKLIILRAFFWRIDILGVSCKTPSYAKIIYMRLKDSKIKWYKIDYS